MDAQIASSTRQQHITQRLALTLFESLEGVLLQQVVDSGIVEFGDTRITRHFGFASISRDELGQQLWCRIGEEVAIGHMLSGLVCFDDDSRHHERRTSQFEEVIRSTHLINSQNISEYLGKETLQVVLRLDVVAVGSLNNGSRQGFAVDLLVLVQRNGVNLHRGSRHHIRRLLVENELVQCLHIYLLVTNDISSNILAAILIVEGLYGSILNARILTDDSLHFLQFDAEAANLHLSIFSSYKLDVAIGQIAHNIACTIAAGILFGIVGKRILDIHLCRLLRTIQVAATYLRTTDPQFTGSTKGQAMALLVDDIKSNICEWFADRNICFVLLQRIDRRKDGTLRRAIAVVHLIVSRRCQCRQFLTTHGEVAQRAVFDIRSKLIAHLCGDKRVGNLISIEIVIEVGKIQTNVLANDIYRSTTGQRRIHIHHTSIEAIRGVCRHMTIGSQSVVALIPMAERHEVAMCQLTALRNSRRARGVKENK